jgi:hypothetical protein
MARKKRNDLLDQMIAKFSLRGMLLHPATLYLGSAVIVLFLAISCWEKYGHRIIDVDAMTLTAEKIQLTPQPSWVGADLKQTVLESVQFPGQRSPSIMDTSLIPSTVTTLESVGWIETIDHIQKSKSGLKIDLTYRLPVAMVEIRPKPVKGFKSTQPIRLHIDRTATLMGKGLSDRPDDYLLVSVDQPMYTDQLIAWSQWQDPRIQNAAAISDFVKDVWQPMGLYRLMTWRNQSNASDRRIPFQFWTKMGQKTGVRVIWGNAPGQELPGEADAAEKVQAMAAYVVKHGRFDQMTDRTLDVRSGRAVVLGDHQHAKRLTPGNPFAR